MKRIIVLFAAGLTTFVLSSVAVADHQNSKRPLVHNNPHKHYKGKDYKFRYGNHDNYNPHHRKCGYMPSGSC
jgi:hypothetical protein